MTEPTVKRYAIYLCSECIAGAGGECHVPGCAMNLNRAPDIPLDPPMTVPLAEALTEMLNTPQTDEFFSAVQIEAAHQVGSGCGEHDARKEPTDWFWLVGFLLGKAVSLPEKREHHIISSAAVLLNWFRRLKGEDGSFQPGRGTGELAPPGD